LNEIVQGGIIDSEVDAFHACTHGMEEEWWHMPDVESKQKWCYQWILKVGCSALMTDVAESGSTRRSSILTATMCNTTYHPSHDEKPACRCMLVCHHIAPL